LSHRHPIPNHPARLRHADLLIVLRIGLARPGPSRQFRRGVLGSSFPWLRNHFADGGYAGDKLQDVLKELGHWTIEIVKRRDVANGLVSLPRHQVVERTFAWVNRSRRLARHVEVTIESAVAWLYIASVTLMSRRLAAA
jgi:transposase